jgi:hypothetical protein
MCQIRNAKFIASHATIGKMRKWPNHFNDLIRKSGPNNVTSIRRGVPRKRGTAGRPSRRRGGTKDMSKRCSIMWALSDKSAKPSKGEPIASHKTESPDKNAANRHIGKRVFLVALMATQPLV